MQDDREDFLAHAYEFRIGLDRARVARLKKSASEVEIEFVRDAPRARRHHHQMRRQEQRLLHAVGDEEAHLARVVPDVEYQLLDGFARERVECAERLVHQHQPRTRGERAGDADALLHASGQLVDRPVGEGVEADQAQLLHRRAAALGRGDATHPKAEFDVLGHVEPRHQGVFLEHHAAIGARSDHRFAVELDRSVRRRQKARDAGKKRRLAAAGRSDRDNEIAVGHRKIDVGKRLDRAGLRGVANAQVSNVERGQRDSVILIERSGPWSVAQ